MINNVSSGEELYCGSFDDSIEQSSIYDKIVFDSVGRELPAIVLTPYCEILHSGKEFLLTVSGLLPAQLVFEEFLEKKGLTQDKILGRESIKQKPYEKFVEEFKEHYLGNRTLKYHFLPASGYKLEHSFIYFRIVKTFLAKELKDKVKIAVLKSPWRESVPSRYAAYSLRIGVPDFTAEFLEVIIGKISNVSVSSYTTFPLTIFLSSSSLDMLDLQVE